MDGFVECQSSNRCGERCAIEDSQVLLGTKDDGLDLVLNQRFSRRNDVTSAKCDRPVEDPDRRVPNESARNIRQGRQI
jgi:hypothetical protein